MPGTVRRLVPNYNNARRYSIRGVVEGNGVRESGWWIFKKRTPVIRVRVREDQLTTFNNIAREQMSSSDHRLEGIASVLQLGMSKEECREYPVGAEVGITFGYSGPLEQYFHGAAPLTLLKLQVMSADVHLENEVMATV